jgi:hypothetical protein
MTASLSYTSQLGYYGLRVNPTFEQVVGTVRKPLGIPLPDRAAKWYATGPYRALILDAAARANDHEAALLTYRNSGASLPETAAGVVSSAAGEDPALQEHDRYHARLEAREAHEYAEGVMRREHERETAVARKETLVGTYGLSRMHPVIEASSQELTDAGVHHNAGLPRIAPVRRAYRTPPPQLAAYGQPQASEFPDFRVLNMGDPPNVQVATLTQSENMTYERLRDNIVGPTFST